MDWVNASYNRVESFAMAADRVLNAAVERCELWLGGRGSKIPSAMGKRPGSNARPPRSA
jgi:hypothetical protein